MFPPGDKQKKLASTKRFPCNVYLLSGERRVKQGLRQMHPNQVSKLEYEADKLIKPNFIWEV